MFRHRHDPLGLIEPHVGHPQAVGQATAGGDVKALLAAAVDEHQAGLRVLDLLDAGDGADLVKRLVREAVGGGRVGTPHLAAFAEAHHPEGGARRVAAFDHVQVAHLEDAQRHPAAGKQNGLQRKQR